MATIEQIELDDALYDRLTAQAASNRVSVQQHIASLLRSSMARHSRNLIEVADAIAAMTPQGVRQTDSTVLVRQSRDE